MGDDTVTVEIKCEPGLLAEAQNSCIILLCSKCFTEETSVAFLPEGRS